MIIKHIYITKEGEPMGNPEMEYPIHGKSCEYSDCKCEIGDPCEAEKKYHSGLLPFEKESVELLKDETFYHKLFKPDTIIPVDLEVTVVDDIARKFTGTWIYDVATPEEIEELKYRKVLRIKP